MSRDDNKIKKRARRTNEEIILFVSIVFIEVNIEILLYEGNIFVLFLM